MSTWCNTRGHELEDHHIKVLREEIVSKFPQQLVKLINTMVCAERLQIEGDAFSAALHHLVKHNVLLYYPKFLPQTVFCDLLVVLTKVTELVQYHHKLRDSPVEGVAVTGDLAMFRDHGLLSVELLRKFPKRYRGSVHLTRFSEVAGESWCHSYDQR